LAATIDPVTSPAALAAITASCALITAAVWLLGLPRLSEPAAAGDTEAKIPYADLARPRVAVIVALLSAAATWVAVTHVPVSALPPWLVLSTLGVALAAVDGYTTWIPARPTRWTWLLMAAAGAITPALGASWTDLIRMVAGAAGVGGLYLLLWAITRGGFGFGDVRYVPLVAAPAAAISIDTLITAMLAGTLLALAHGLWHHATHRPGLHPWAPALTLGPFIAAAAIS